MRRPAPQALPLILALLLAALAMPGCDDDPETGRVHLVMTDAPYPVDMIDAAEVTVEAVSVHVSGGDDDDGWHYLPYGPSTYDLLELRNGVTADLVDAEVPVGELDEVRLVVSSGRIVLVDGREFELTVPSGSASGLKLKVRPPIRIEGDLTTDVLLDVDVSRSFRPIPSSAGEVVEIDSFHFHPVVRVADLGSTGSVAGHVLSDEGTPDHDDDTPLEAATVLVHANDDTTTAFTDSTGYYEVMGLYAGEWSIEADADGHGAAATTVDVYAGNRVQAGSLRLPLVPAPR